MLFKLPPMLVGQPISIYEYTVSKQEPRFPVLSTNSISALIAFIIVAMGLISQEWKKAVATCSMVAAVGPTEECHCQCVTK